MSTEAFFEALSGVRQQVLEKLLGSPYFARLAPDHLREGAASYVRRTGKAMRPAALMWSAGVTGGEDRVPAALPAAAAIEIFHTWSIVHDDIIDRDDTRRGGPSVHAQFREQGAAAFGMEPDEAAHYGVTVALLTGDAQMGWVVDLLAEYFNMDAVDPRVGEALIRLGIGQLQPTLIEGEMRDVQFSYRAPSEITVDEVLAMYHAKTGFTFEVAARMGAMIGANDPDLENPVARALGKYLRLAGLAFQIQDDVLGLIGDPEKLGKPVGADIREGKLTPAVSYALANADESRRAILESALGNANAPDDLIADALDAIDALGGINYARGLASDYVQRAIASIDTVPDSVYTRQLRAWGLFVIERAK